MKGSGDDGTEVGEDLVVAHGVDLRDVVHAVGSLHGGWVERCQGFEGLFAASGRAREEEDFRAVVAHWEGEFFFSVG